MSTRLTPTADIDMDRVASASHSASTQQAIAERVAKFARADRWFERTTLGFAALVLLALAGLLASLVIQAWPAFREFGPGFLAGTTWSPSDDVYGAVIAIYGTLVTSAIALVLAVPISFGIALFLTETCPMWLRRPLGTAIELLAGVPSIIYGIWGLFILAPLFQKYAQPLLVATGLPLFAGPPLGIGVFTAGMVLALMVIPFTASVMRDVFETVPPVLKESAYGLGCTTWEVVRNVVLPYTRVGVIGGIMLGLGRALGETMAVTFVIGNANRLSPSLFAPGNSIASTLANEFAEADPKLHVPSLFALGLLLFVITFFVLAAARWLTSRGTRKAGI
ncbi:MAG: phosphate ABC transporter permease subunit PstC [Burkholderiaceae bacterium]|nr:phosphate ABC transporter permease subunit PstC [Burkholderiales bacterium]MCZ8101279.1 phosphate ABC transporter permease subunit PstC [Burkholderiales bacterium]MCZ8339976.1 phosphate ABC transporter permease subunit PstC [Burkholderiaceae bacterium]